jgi:hypothetical protein
MSCKDGILKIVKLKITKFMNISTILIGIIVFIIVLTGVNLVVEKEKHSCNKVIFLKGELSQDINRVDYIANGEVARIYYCDGTREDVPTSRIIKVVDK